MGCRFRGWYTVVDRICVGVVDLSITSDTYFKGRKCCMCGGSNTYMNNPNSPEWRRSYDSKGNWTGGYLCRKCYQNDQRSKTKIAKNRMLENRKCNKCGSEDTRTNSRRIPLWFKEKDKKGNWNGKWLCSKCYYNILNNLPDSYKNIIKSMARSRNVIIDLDNFGEFTDNDKSMIGENIATDALGAINCNLEFDDYNFPFDLRHEEKGRINVKIRTMNCLRRWNFDTDGKENCDVFVLLCMDNNIPWRNIYYVYIIPVHNIDARGITIVDNPNSRWERFRVDPLPYYDSYYKLYLKKYLYKEC